MTPERFRRVEELYHAACEGTREERAALLAEADPELRHELEALLAEGSVPTSRVSLPKSKAKKVKPSARKAKASKRRT